MRRRRVARPDVPLPDMRLAWCDVEDFVERDESVPAKVLATAPLSTGMRLPGEDAAAHELRMLANHRAAVALADWHALLGAAWPVVLFVPADVRADDGSSPRGCIPGRPACGWRNHPADWLTGGPDVGRPPVRLRPPPVTLLQRRGDLLR